MTCVLLLACGMPHAGWPTDDEPMGLMGCRWFRFRGVWESLEVSFSEEENINAACLTVAVASVINHNRWPRASYFDALFARCRERGEHIPVAHAWNFGLINGPGPRHANCENDDPERRWLPGDSSWSGVSEIRKLMYVIERAYGHDHECFRAKSAECEGLGDFPVHHLMRNRFGYPHASSISVRNPAAQKTAIRNIREGFPVIAVKCEHVYPLDGYRVDPQSGVGQFHACDYVSAMESTGWFTWKQLLETGLIRIIADLNPDIHIRPKPGQAKIACWFGDDYLPQTSHGSRKAFLRIQSATARPIGPLDVEVSIRQHDSSSAARPLAAHRGNVGGTSLRVPATGTFSFTVGRASVISVVLRNNGDADLTLRMTLHDFAGSHDLERWRETRLFGSR